MESIDHMEIVEGWRVVKMTKTDTGREKQEILSRVFHVRDAALIYAKWYGDGAYVQAVKKHIVGEAGSLC